MKRGMVCMVLVLTLALSMSGVACVGLAEDSADDIDVIYFDAKLTDEVDRRAQDWMLNDDTRALATVYLVMDVAAAAGEKEMMNCLTQPSFIGRDGGVIYLYLHGDDSDYLVYYEPLTGEAAYAANEYSSDEVIRIAMDESCPDGYYRNSVESLIKVLEQLEAVLSRDE